MDSEGSGGVAWAAMEDVKARAAAELLEAEHEFRRAQGGGRPETYAKALARLRAAELAVDALLSAERVSAEALADSLGSARRQ